jgi:hypothetical protein
MRAGGRSASHSASNAAAGLLGRTRRGYPRAVSADPIDPREREEADAAAAEAAGIGGRADPAIDPAQRPVVEAGGGEAEGFEQAEAALIEHASHTDQQAAHAILRDRGAPEEPAPQREDGEADHERSAEYPEPQE